MLWTRSVAIATALAGYGFAKELAPNNTLGEVLYDSGIMMERIMMRKVTKWDQLRKAGRFASEQYPPIDTMVKCVDGLATAIPGNANYTFRCNNIDLYSFKSHASLGSPAGEGSSSWGWTSPQGREFIAVGQSDGTAFVEISKEGKIIFLGRLPRTPGSLPIIWREIRLFKDYAIIGTESDDHGIQIFDMRKLLEIDPASPKTFSHEKDLTSFYNKLPSGRTHTIQVNEETNFIYSAGARPRNDTCRSGLIFINVTDITNPTSPGCAWEDGYVHDAQCLIYRGPDKKFVGREICYGYNEDTLTIYDVTDKTKPIIVSRTSYEGAQYTHQGWVLDKQWQEWLLMDDEYDEIEEVGLARDGRPVTYIWNIADLTKPRQTGYFKSSQRSIDHNMYVIDGYAYQSHYGSGFRVLDVRSVPTDPTGKGVKEIGFFDIYPEDDGEERGGVSEFIGTWSSYAYFKSGFIFVNTIERGGFVVKMASY
ncbi:Arylsulfatase [Venturia nashicola]|nr:Arylsulfatase [Venturia nashicola]